MRRIVDKDLCVSYRNRPCLACGSTLTVGHHLKTVGSGGDDHVDNLIPLCVFPAKDHHGEIHRLGNRIFAEKYKIFEMFLLEHNWKKDEFDGKWLRLTSKGWD